MFETLYIQNFQAHSKLKIDFDSKVTTIVGPSDVGKSAIIRALRWVCRNQPSGEAFIKDGEKGTTVRLIVDGNKIGRKRGRGQNTYLLNGEEYKAFGNDLPDRISEVLNTGGVNFQGQHDAPFWFAESAGEVSRQLNAVVDLGVIDDSLTAIGKKVRRFYQESQITRDRLQSAKKRKEELKWVVVADVEFKAIEDLQGKRNKIAVDCSDLASTTTHIQILHETRHRATSQGIELRAAEVLGRDCVDVSRRRFGLSNLMDLISTTRKILDVEIPDICVIDQVVQLYNKVKTEKKVLEESVQDLNNTQMTKDGWQRQREKAEEDFSVQIEGELCPVCGKEF